MGLFSDFDIQMSFVYLIQGVDGGPVKIVRTRKIERRLAELQKESSVELVVRERLKDVPGEADQLRKRFAENRIRGSWFKPHPGMPGVIYQGRKMPSLRARRNADRIIERVNAELLGPGRGVWQPDLGLLIPQQDANA